MGTMGWSSLAGSGCLQPGGGHMVIAERNRGKPPLCAMCVKILKSRLDGLGRRVG